MRKSMLFEAVAVILLVLLVFVLYVMVTTGGQSGPGQWTLSGLTVSSDAGSSMFMGPSNELYVINGEYINAVSPGGKVMWQARIPNDLDLLRQSYWASQKEFNGNFICLLLYPVEARGSISQELVVLTTNGRLLWSMPLNDTLSNGQPNNAISIWGGHIYLQSGSAVTVYDRRGTALWNLSDVYYQPAVGNDGTLYVARGDYAINRIEAYGLDGDMKWSYNLENYSVPAQDTWQSHANPIYSDHTIYVQQGRGLMALNEDGSLRWKKLFNATRFYESFQDGRWYVTMNCVNGRQVDTNDLFTTVIGPDGTESAPPRTDVRNIPTNVTTTAELNGIVYYIGKNTADRNVTLDELSTYRISARDAASGNELWNYTIKPDRMVNTTLNESTAGGIMYQETQYGVPYNVIWMNRIPPDVWYKQQSYPYGYKEVRQSSDIRPIPWDGGVYVSYWAYNYEYPFFFDKSRCVYGGGLYALDRNGTLLWEAPTDSEIVNILVNNSTVYYSTREGKLSASTGGAIAGLALTTIFYLFIRFFLAGAVTRARGIVEKNENRHRVLKYIADNPGTSLFDISKELKINMGTARYHLMILGINHRIISYKADDKYVRYFTNAGSYSREQQLVISLMRRDGVRKVLNALLERPGLSNIELSNKVRIPESSASRYMRELVDKGVVLRDRSGDGRLSYTLNKEYLEPITFAFERMGD